MKAPVAEEGNSMQNCHVRPQHPCAWIAISTCFGTWITRRRRRPSWRPKLYLMGQQGSSRQLISRLWLMVIAEIINYVNASSRRLAWLIDESFLISDDGKKWAKYWLWDHNKRHFEPSYGWFQYQCYFLCMLVIERFAETKLLVWNLLVAQNFHLESFITYGSCFTSLCSSINPYML